MAISTPNAPASGDVGARRSVKEFAHGAVSGLWGVITGTASAYASSAKSSSPRT